MLRYWTAGESHGKTLLAIVDGFPAGLALKTDPIDVELRRRQGGYGRGGRQRIETDAATFLAGVRLGRTTGGPLVVQVPNRDSRLDDLERTPPVHRPRPGHADLAGSIKWLTTDCRATLERASARETAARTAAGAIARCLLAEFGWMIQFNIDCLLLALVRIDSCPCNRCTQLFVFERGMGGMVKVIGFVFSHQVVPVYTDSIYP